MLKKLAVILGALGLTLGLAAPASAAVVYPTDFAVVNQASIFNEDGVSTLRIKNVNDWSSYAYTGYLQGVLNSKPGQRIEICAKYRGNQPGMGAQIQINNGVWSVVMPVVFSEAYAVHCVTTTNSTSQPYGVVWVGGYSGASANILIRNIKIT